METIVKLDSGSVQLPNRIGTDKELLNREVNLRVKTKGRPKINREIAYQLIKAGYSTHHICRILKCSRRTVKRFKEELKERGEIPQGKMENLERLEKSDLDFDEECNRAIGISYLKWLKNRSKRYQNFFNFSKEVWDQIWDKPTLILLKDRDNQLGDQLCMKFLEVFGEDTKRIRRRKKMIRYLFRFLGRQDLCDRYLTMTNARDPVEIREIPEITMLDFPLRLDKAISLIGEKLGSEYATALRFKIVTQMRTGNTNAGRELMGITCGERNDSWIIFENEHQFRGQIKAKDNETWVLEWIPLDIRKEVYAIYQQRQKGETLFQIDIRTLRKIFKEICDSLNLPLLNLHDLRKVAVTWLWVMGIDLAIATELNVGWKDLNTAKKHYLTMNQLLKKSDRLAYRERIASWFKDGLEEYLPF